MSEANAVVVLSGGLDSTVLAYEVRDMIGDDHIIAVSFNYGQKHSKELSFASNTAWRIGAQHVTFNMDWLGDIFRSVGAKSSLITEADVPEGHYTDESMKSTVVPNRNMIMASIAAGVAVSSGAEYLALGVHSGDHEIYPDCRPEFIEALEEAIRKGNDGFLNPYFQVYAPFLRKTKTDIVKLGYDLAVPFEDTWSCYKGLDAHCGVCGTCVERKEAFQQAEVTDPTNYLE